MRQSITGIAPTGEHLIPSASRALVFLQRPTVLFEMPSGGRGGSRTRVLSACLATSLHERYRTYQATILLLIALNVS